MMAVVLALRARAAGVGDNMDLLARALREDPIRTTERESGSLVVADARRTRRARAIPDAPSTH
jgi:hypothetical protein